MKKILIINILGCFLFSCNKSSFLNRTPIDFPTENAFYKNVEGLEGGLIGCYKSLSSGEQYGGTFLTLMEKRADNVKNNNPGGGGGVEYAVSSFTDTPANMEIDRAWKSLYKMIYRTNKVINSIDKVSMNDKTKNQLLGQASFLRALAYFNLVRLFGKVPLIIKPQTVEEARHNKRDSVDKIYEQIIADLKVAENLPDTWKDSERGRATSYAAKALLGKVYLYQKKYPEVVQTLEPLIDVINKGKELSLVPSNKTFPNEIKVSKDIIFAVLYLKGGFGTGVKQNSRYRNNDNSNQIILPQDLFESNDNRKPLVTPTNSGARPEKFNTPSLNGEVSGDFPILRCSDVVLMYGEAIAQVGSWPNAEALKTLNEIRKNAGLQEKSLSDFHSKEDFIDALLLQRRLELSLECDRWFDMVRTGEFHKVYPNIPAYRALYPIPQDEIENLADKADWQNPGY